MLVYIVCPHLGLEYTLYCYYTSQYMYSCVVNVIIAYPCGYERLGTILLFLTV